MQLSADDENLNLWSTYLSVQAHNHAKMSIHLHFRGSNILCCISNEFSVHYSCIVSLGTIEYKTPEILPLHIWKR